MDNKKIAIIGAGVAVAGIALYYIFKSKNNLQDRQKKIDEVKEEEEKALRHVPGIQKMPESNNQTKAAAQAMPKVKLDKERFTKKMYMEVLKKGTLEHKICLATWYKLASKMINEDRSRINETFKETMKNKLYQSIDGINLSNARDHFGIDSPTYNAIVI